MSSSCAETGTTISSTDEGRQIYNIPRTINGRIISEDSRSGINTRTTSLKIARSDISRVYNRKNHTYIHTHIVSQIHCP
jgi:hypothetical protein